MLTVLSHGGRSIVKVMPARDAPRRRAGHRPGRDRDNDDVGMGQVLPTLLDSSDSAPDCRGRKLSQDSHHSQNRGPGPFCESCESCEAVCSPGIGDLLTAVFPAGRIVPSSDAS